MAMASTPTATDIGASGDDDPALAALRHDVRLLARRIEGEPLIYLDSAASSLTPGRVLRAMIDYYENHRANVHRGKHLLSEEASEAFEDARRKVARFVNADPAAVVFTAGTTASINLVVLGLQLTQADVVVTTSAEHHAVLLPLMGRATVRMLDVGVDGLVDPDALLALVDERTRLVALAHASNVTGAVHDVAGIITRLRRRAPAARVLLDAAQSVAHLPLDVDALGADFVAFSAHKLLGPTGVGVLTGKKSALDSLSVELRGGGAVRLVEREAFHLRPLPAKLEPGTPDIAGVIGLGAAVELLGEIGMDRVYAHGRRLAARLWEGVRELPGVLLLGPPSAERLPLVSLALRSSTLSSDHVAMILSDTHHIMVRSGHHCCHPFFDTLSRQGLPLHSALRASAGPYTTAGDVDAFTRALRQLLGTLVA